MGRPRKFEFWFVLPSGKNKSETKLAWHRPSSRNLVSLRLRNETTGVRVACCDLSTLKLFNRGPNENREFKFCNLGKKIETSSGPATAVHGRNISFLAFPRYID